MNPIPENTTPDPQEAPNDDGQSSLKDETQPTQDDSISSDPSRITDELEIISVVNAVIEHYVNTIDGELKATGFTTGLDALDMMTGGLKPGKIFVVASHPLSGKTSMIASILEHLVLEKQNSTMVLLGAMSAFEFVQRLILGPMNYYVDYESNLSTGVPTKVDLQRIKALAIKTKSSQLIVVENKNFDIEVFCENARSYQKREGLKFIVIDDLHFLLADPSGRSNSRKSQMDTIMTKLKALAIELDILILVTTCLKRPRISAEHCPVISDIRYSRVIESHADTISILRSCTCPTDFDWIKTGPRKRYFELHIVKNRNRRTGFIELKFLNKTLRFKAEPKNEPDGTTSGGWI